LGMGCARCHDHKFDPILQRDYFRLRSYFEPLLPADNATIASKGPGAGLAERQAAWYALTADIRAEMDKLAKPHRENAEQDAIKKFTPDIQELIATPTEQLSRRQQQIQLLANRQVILAREKAIPGRLNDEDEKRWKELNKQLEQYEEIRPETDSDVDTVTDVGAVAPPTTIPDDRANNAISPGPLTVLDPEPADIQPPENGWPDSTGRRTALAQWLTRPDHPLTTRVIVNRLWQGHFGRGIVATASDFGRLGEKPTHPELLDWLATKLVEDGWNLKAIHRLILTSATYRQSAIHPEATSFLEVDPENLWLWHWKPRRLEAEPIRDALLAVSGELDLTQGGPSVDHNQPRRSIYLKFKRNSKEPLLDAFDIADGYNSTANRDVTTTPTQSLLMINGPWVIQRAEAFADRLLTEQDLSLEDRIDRAYRLAFARPASEAEIEKARQFLASNSKIDRSAWVDFCHVLLNTNEFLYVD